MVRDVHVECAAGGAPQFLIGNERDTQTAGGVEHCEVEAELIEPLIEEPGKHRSGAIASVFGRSRPPSLLSTPELTSLFGSLIQHVCDALVAPGKGVGDTIAGDPLQVVEYGWSEFQVVPIRIDNRMVQAIVNRL